MSESVFIAKLQVRAERKQDEVAYILAKAMDDMELEGALVDVQVIE